MTDNDDPAAPHRAPSFARGTDEPAEAGGRSSKEGERARVDGARTRIAPTDPEVPSAKRRGAIRHQRSLVGLTAVVMGLLSITLALLYRASRKVGSRDDEIGAVPRVLHPRRETTAFSRDHVDGNAGDPSSSPLPARSGGLHEPHSDDSSNDSAPAGSASAAPKTQPPALDIIRRPPF
jgi:hypothetical protein